MSDTVDVYFNKTKPREIKLELYQNEFGKCLNLQQALNRLMDSFVPPPATNLRLRNDGTWFNTHTGETLTDREVKRRFLLWTLEQMKDSE